MLGSVTSAWGMEAELAWAAAAAWVRVQGVPAQKKKMEGVD